MRCQTVVSVDPEIDRLSIDNKRKAGARVTVTLESGRTLTAWTRWTKGPPENPMTRPDVPAKFRALAGRVLAPGEIDSLVEYLEGLHAPDTSVDFSRWSSATTVGDDQRASQPGLGDTEAT